jgi:heptosyltransferase-2
MAATEHKILVIGPSWIGDMVMAQALFKTLKSENADVIIDVLALDWTKPLLARMPEVNIAISMPVSHGVFGWNMRKKLGHSLRDQHYQQAIVLPNSWKSALIPWFANIPIRTGWRGEQRYGLLNDMRILDKQALPMMVQRYVSLANPASQAHSPPSYQAPLMLAQQPKKEFNFLLDPDKKRLLFCPGAEFGPAKQWPASHFSGLANIYLAQGWQLLIMGSKADADIAKQIMQLIPDHHQSDVFNLCGKTILGDAIDLLSTADLVVSNDSGLMHISAALQKNLMVIYGPTSPSFTPPLASNSQIVQLDVECGPCFQKSCPEGHHKCMQDLSSDIVFNQINKS